jgi:YggT family protein
VGVNAILVGIDALTAVLRVGLFGVGVIVAALAGLSYAVRTRRINPFNPIARTVRRSVDPLFAPVERRVVRAGGRPATAPWWALAAVVVLGIVLVSVLGFVRQQLTMAFVAANGGALGIATLLVVWTFGILQLALLVRVISSWFQVSPYSRWLRWSFVLTDWFLRPLRQIIPTLGMVDVSPIVAYFLLSLVERGVLGLMG